MRPLYETNKQLEAEKNLAGQLEKSWVCQLHKMPKTAPVDYVVTKDGVVRGFIEIKIRSNASTKYPTYMISQKKIDAAKKLFEASGLKTQLIVKWTDVVGRVTLNEDYPTRMGGRFDRNDKADVETVADIDISLFTIPKEK